MYQVLTALQQDKVDNHVKKAVIEDGSVAHLTWQVPIDVKHWSQERCREKACTSGKCRKSSQKRRMIAVCQNKPSDVLWTSPEHLFLQPLPTPAKVLKILAVSPIQCRVCSHFTSSSNVETNGACLREVWLCSPNLFNKLSQSLIHHSCWSVKLSQGNSSQFEFINIPYKFSRRFTVVFQQSFEEFRDTLPHRCYVYEQSNAWLVFEFFPFGHQLSTSSR